MARYRVRFKEAYLPKPVERTCDVPDESEVIRIYGLDEPDIEWYDITEDKG